MSSLLDSIQHFLLLIVRYVDRRPRSFERGLQILRYTYTSSWSMDTEKRKRIVTGASFFSDT